MLPTKETYVCPKGEEMLYHCIIEVRKFNSETGERQSVPRVQKFGKKAFETGVHRNLLKQGYTIEILHAPLTEEEVEAKKIAEKAEADAKIKAHVDAEIAKVKAEAEAEKQKAIDEAVKKALLAERRETAKRGRKPNNADAPAEATEEKTEE